MKHLLLFVGALSICAGSFAICPKHGSSCGYANGGHLNGYRPAPPGQSNTTSNATPISSFGSTSIPNNVYTSSDVPKGEKNVTIPVWYNSVKRGTFMNNTDIETVVVPSNISIIRSETFKNCTNLKHILLSNSVAYIEEEAFAGCPNLKRVHIGPNVVHIAPNAFMSDCQLDIDPNNSYLSLDNGAMIDKGSRELLRFYSSDSTEYTVPSNVKTIGNGAFKDAKNLKVVRIPATVKSIGKDAFEGCDDLVVIVSKKSKKSYDIRTFYGCKSVSFEE
ncbi:MAG: leucine-rich repeat domain-containing protein [Paludibacteraceae bacterium]|nr:leucine-rich repeat domain-containing protein [Paludibacteraceae bacterium]